MLFRSVRQLLLTVLMGLAYVAGLPMDAVTAMIVTAVSIWLPIIAQFLLVNHRLSGHIAPGPKAYDFKTWLVTALPILMAGGFYSLLAYTDVLVLQHFRAPDEVAVYYAAVKTLALACLSITRYRRRPRTVSAVITSPGIMPACRLSFLGPSNGRSGHR